MHPKYYVLNILDLWTQHNFQSKYQQNYHIQDYFDVPLDDEPENTYVKCKVVIQNNSDELQESFADLTNIIKEEKPVQCNLCLQYFSSAATLEGHRRIHRGLKEC